MVVDCDYSGVDVLAKDQSCGQLADTTPLPGPLGFTSFCMMTCIASASGQTWAALSPSNLGLKNTCQTVNVGRNTVPSLSSGGVNGFSDLNHLFAERVGLTTLANGAFSSAPRLRSLHLGGNSLIGISGDAFTALISLEYLDLSGPAMPTGGLAIAAFKPLASLSTLYGLQTVRGS